MKTTNVKKLVAATFVLVTAKSAVSTTFGAAAGLALMLAPLSARAQAVTTIYMSSNSDDINQYTPPGPVSNVAHLPLATNPETIAEFCKVS